MLRKTLGKLVPTLNKIVSLSTKNLWDINDKRKIIYSQEKNQLLEPNCDMTQMFKLSDEGFKLLWLICLNFHWKEGQGDRLH